MKLLPTRAFCAAVIAMAVILSASVSADQSVPFKGHASETITGLNVVADGIEVTTFGYGNSTHLGLFVRLTHALIHPDGTVDGSTGWLTARGDILILDLHAVPLSAASFGGTYSIVFGNGRFADAAGGADFLASTTDGLSYAIQFAGQIDY